MPGGDDVKNKPSVKIKRSEQHKRFGTQRKLTLILKRWQIRGEATERGSQAYEAQEKAKAGRKPQLDPARGKYNPKKEDRYNYNNGG